MEKKLLFISLLFSAVAFAKTETGFIENKGQYADHNGDPLAQVLFRSEGTGPSLYITTSGLTCVFKQKQAGTENAWNWSKIEIEAAGATIDPQNIIAEDPAPGVSNFYLPNCPNGILGVKTYHKITIREVYPGIDWVFNADAVNGVSHDFVVHAGADVSQIKLLYKGLSHDVSFDENERMVLNSPYGTLYEGKLNAYELSSKKSVKTKMLLEKGDVMQAGFNFDPAQNRTVTIVIDPPLQWSMPQASTGNDYGYGVSALRDGTGDVVVSGITDGTDFPTMNAYQGSLSGLEDMVIMRLNGSGTRLWSTYYGGTDYDGAKGISSDNTGNCYVVGYTMSSDFPTLLSTQTNFGGGTYDAAAIKFNSSGVRQWATWIGGIGNDYGNAIVADSVGNCYVTGYTTSTNFPTLSAHQGTKNTGADAFITKYSSAGTMLWSTFFGGDDEDKGRAITLDASATNLYLAGTTISGGFPITAGCFQNSSGSAYFAEEGFILKMNVTTQAVGFCSFLGGNDGDFAQGVAVDNTGTIYVTGYTLSSNFPIVNPGNNAYVDSTIGSLGTHDAFIMSCNNTGTTRNWSTYFGGTAPDMGFGITTRPNAGIFICGNTSSTDLDTHQPFDSQYYQGTQGDGGGFYDMFYAWFGTNDSLQWSTYYGMTTSDEAYAISSNSNNELFAAGIDSNEIAVLKFSFSNPLGIFAQAPVSNEISVYPNPASEQLVITVQKNKAETATIEIYDPAGRLVWSGSQELISGENKIRVGVKDLAPSVYSLKITDAGGVHVSRFVKQ